MKTLKFTACFLGVMIASGAAMAGQTDEIRLTLAENHFDVAIGGKPFTTYWFGPRDDRPYVRPFFFPVLASDGVGVTDDRYADHQKNPKADHPHHQSLWVSHGDVNGVDHWSLGKDGSGKGVPQQRHLGMCRGPDAMVIEVLVWDDNDGNPLLNETRMLHFIAYPDGARGIDVTSMFTPAAGNVTFNDTKEAGMLAVRLADSIAAHPTITQSTGAGGEGIEGEKQTWGHAADWCDESGPIDGKTYGVAIFDAPSNPRHPATWHVRAYGLMSSNIFGLSEFDKSKPKGAGNLLLEKGKTLTFHHLAVIHEGGAAEAHLADKYKQFALESAK